MICHLAHYGGLRVAEIVALEAADVRLSVRKGSVRVRGRGRLGGTDRTVPPHAQARTTPAELLDPLHPRFGGGVADALVGAVSM